MTFLNFKTVWVLYYVAFSIGFGLISISIDQKLPFIDAVFTTASAMTGAGLSTIPMYDITGNVFALLGILVLIGNPVSMMVITMLYRRHCYWKLCSKIITQQKKGILPRRFSPEALEIIQDHEQVDDALELLIWLVLVYFLFWILFGSLILFWAFASFPIQPELEQRGFSYFDSAVFLAVNGFGNAGFALTTDNLVGIRDNPAAYLWLTVLIVAGNTGVPIMLRFFIATCLKVEEWVLKHYAWAALDSSRVHSRKTLKFILDNPRRLTTNLFSYFSTKILTLTVLALILIQYFFFLGSSWNQKDLIESGLTSTEIAGIGYFQTLSTRTAGFSMMDLRQLNQGLLFVYCVMMYLSAFPLVTTLHASQTSTTNENVGKSRSNTLLRSRSGTGHFSSSSVFVDSPSKLLNNTLGSERDELSPNKRIKPGNNDNKEEARTQDENEPSIASFLKDSVLRQRKQAQEFVLTSQAGVHDKLPTKEEDADDNDKPLQDNASGAQKAAGKHYLLRHSFFIFLAVVVCAFSENHMLANPTIDVNLWYVVFEIVSAYGAVGLSLGYPGKPYSLSGAMTPLGKLTIIFLMFMGKHRGLPSPKDEVVDFDFKNLRHACGYYNPSELIAQEEEEAMHSQEEVEKQLGEHSELSQTVYNPINTVCEDDLV